MSLLEQLVSPSKRPIAITLVSAGGLGKTTLASMFPNPVFCRTEDGTQSIAHRSDVAMFPVSLNTWEIMDQVRALQTDKHSFQTLVIDSITQYNTIAEQEVIAMDGKAKGINQALGGYGAGHNAVSGFHFRLRDECRKLQEMRGMHIVFIAHADSETVNSPDQEPYMRYTIRMNNKSISHYSDNVDIVAFIKLKMFTTGEGDKKRAVDSGERVITCYPTASHISKNRFGIDQDLVFTKDVNPFGAFL